MGFYNKYPYTDFHELNLDWFLEEFKKIVDKVLDLEAAFNTLKEYIDEYFNNLDLQQQVNNYFQSIIDSGEFFTILKKFYGSDLVNESNYRPYAQVLPELTRTFNTGYSTQGFAIGEYNGNPVMMNCFINTDRTQNEVVFTRFDEGNEAEITRFTIPNSGHMNSACYNPDNEQWYIACAGGSDSSYEIIEVDGSLNGTYFAYSMHNSAQASIEPWAISYNQGLYYVLSNGGYLLKYQRLNDDPVEEIPIEFIPNVVYQGIYVDDLFMYLPCGNTITTASDQFNNVNYVDVRYHDGSMCKTIDATFPLEMEEIAVYDGVCYMSAATQDAALISKIDLYLNNNWNSLKLADIPGSLYREFDIFIDETYTGFLMDGLTVSTPLSSLAWYYITFPTTASYVRIYLLSDSIHAFTLYSEYSKKVALFGLNYVDYSNPDSPVYYYTKRKITWMEVYANDFVAQYLIMTGHEWKDTSLPENAGYVNHSTIRCTCNRTYFRNIDIGVNGSPIEIPSAIELFGGYFQFFDTYVYDYMHTRLCDIEANGSFYVDATNCTNLGSNNAFNGIIIFDGKTNPIQWSGKMYFKTNNGNQIPAGNNRTYDFNNFKTPGIIVFNGTSGNTLSNTPAGFDTGLLMVDVKMLSANKIIMTFYKSDGSTATKVV